MQTPENFHSKNTDNAFVKRLEDSCGLTIAQEALAEALKMSPSAQNLLKLNCAPTGFLVWIPQNTTLSEPIILSHVLQTDPTEAFPITLIILENNAHCQVIQNVKVVQNSAQNSFNSLIYTHLRSGSSLNYTFAQSLNPQCTSHVTFHSVLEDASLTHTTISVSGRSVTVDNHIHLNAKSAHAEAYGLAVANASEVAHWQVVQNHNAPETTSVCLQKTIATDEASAHFSGSVNMPFPLCSASQRNDNQLLSENAKATSSPAIYIKTDNVTCTHGTTVGHVNAEDLFYAQTRGLSKDDARKLLALGFAQTILDKIPQPSLQQSLTEDILHVL
jgi:Fe-S cluster assembly protein SufD